MTLLRRERIEELFERALDRPASERAAWLAAECSGDDGLRLEVERLLAAHDRAGGVLSLPSPAGSMLAAPAAREESLTRVGPYRLVREVGYGGMGSVFLAERDDDLYQQRVAVKIIRRGLDTDELVRRFVAERQILATLQHPNIARLLDGGVTSDGRPYYVMEYVDGEPLDVHCDRRRCHVDERLRLFAVVARAVQFAHQNLVVHRDLKPSNVFVTRDGEIRLLDFGIAKLLDPDTAPHAVPETQTGVRMMTPQYASPEQMRGDAITTATDVYGLGLLLYELLTGHRPFGVRGHSLVEIERRVLTEEPQRPSAAVLRSPEKGEGGDHHPTTPAAVAQARGTHPERLARKLRGDLDRIVLCALRKEPGRRYASADAFADDVERYLAGKTVAARGDSLGYRARKFVWRHRLSVATAGVFVLLLGGYAATVTVQARRVSAALEQARLEAEKSEQITGFMMGLFEGGDPRFALGDTITARSLLERGVARAGRLRERPLLQAQMLGVIGRVYQSLGEYGRASALLEQALATRRRELGEAHADVALSYNQFGNALRLKGDYAAAETALRRALTLHQRLLGPDHATVAADRHDLAIVLADRGDYAAAEPLLRQALATQRERLGAQHVDVAKTLSGLGYLMTAKGDLRESERLYREALVMRRALLGSFHPDVAQSLSAVGTALNRLGDYPAGLKLHREALAINQRLYGAEHPVIVTNLSNIATGLARSDDLPGAERMLRQSVAMARKTLGPEHVSTAVGLNNLAVVLGRQKKYAAAESLMREVIAIRVKSKGPEHADVASGLHNLGNFVNQLGDRAQAERLHRQALAMRRKLLSPEHQEVASSLNGLGEVLRDRGKYAAADSALRQSLAIRRKLLGDAHPDVQVTARNLLDLYRRWGRAERADPAWATLAGGMPPATRP